MDAALAGPGFMADRELLEHVSGLEPGAALDLAVDVVAAVRGLVGDHVAHNAYFIDFPDGVPDTVEFWVASLRAAVGARAGGADAGSSEEIAVLERPPLPPELITRASALIDRELSARLPRYERLVVDPAVLDVALPLSGKASENGFAGPTSRGRTTPRVRLDPRTSP